LTPRSGHPILKPVDHTVDRYDLGIVGGGQLGRMLALAAAPLGLRCIVLDPDPACAAAQVADTIVAPLNDAKALHRLVTSAAVTTFEIEHTAPAVLSSLEDTGATIRPSPRTLAVVADKLRQKETLREAGLPVPVILARTAPGRSSWTHPVVQKSRFGGYDGRGVAVVPGGEDMPLPGDTFVETAVEIERELAVLVVRDTDGVVDAWAPVDMVFDSTLNLVSDVIVPAEIPEEVRRRAVEISIATARVLGEHGLVGVLAVELFLDRSGRILINEVAPRPHNSGHITMESSQCDQFEQHVRAVLGLPLGSTALRTPAAMTNIVGPPHSHSGAYRVIGRRQVLADPTAHLHLYGKPAVRPGRKMGHVTCTDPSTADALSRARTAAAAVAFAPSAQAKGDVQ